MISISTSKSGSNWLDRLRSSRGFPTGNEPDLDRFLASTSSCSSGSSTRSESTQFRRRVNSVGAQNDAVAAVLSHLFNMGERSSIAAVSRKKNCRKQSNPKFFNSANLGKNNNNNHNKELCSSSGDNDNDVAVDNDNKEEEEYDDDDDDGDDDDDRVDMKEYTRSEVTVIDTSLSDWKIDKLVFRRNNDWKIKDKKKKKKTSNDKVNSRKRKLLGNEDDDDEDDNVDDVVKKRSVESGDVDVETKFKEKKKVLHMNKPRNDKARELLKEAAEFVGKVPQTRCPCPRPPDKLRIESSPAVPLKSIPSCNNANPDKLRIDNSPVILLKSIPSINNGNGIMRLGKSAKKGRPKKFAFI